MYTRKILETVRVLQQYNTHPVPSSYKNIVDHLISLILDQRYDDAIDRRLIEIQERNTK